MPLERGGGRSRGGAQERRRRSSESAALASAFLQCLSNSTTAPVLNNAHDQRASTTICGFPTACTTAPNPHGSRKDDSLKYATAVNLSCFDLQEMLRCKHVIRGTVISACRACYPPWTHLANSKFENASCNHGKCPCIQVLAPVQRAFGDKQLAAQCLHKIAS